MDNASNEARSYIIKNCFDTTGDLPVLDYSKVPISRGYIQKPEITSASLEGRNLEIKWRLPYRGEDVKADVRVMVMVYSDFVILNKSQYFFDIATRKMALLLFNYLYAPNPFMLGCFSIIQMQQQVKVEVRFLIRCI